MNLAALITVAVLALNLGSATGYWIRHKEHHP